MSRVNPDEDVKLQNPAVRFYDWSGAEGKFSYYDKEAKKKVIVDLPFTFLPIERCITLKGYNDDTKTSYWSNEVKDNNKDIFILQSVTTVNGNKKITTVAKGLYKDIKPTLDSLDISYVESMYIGVKGAKGLELCNFQIKGSALGAWFEFCSKNKIWEIAVSVSSCVDKKKGAVKYKEPAYAAINKISSKMQEEAVELNKQLLVYLNEYFAKNKVSAASVESEAEATTTVNKSEDKKPFDDSKHPQAQHSELIDTESDIITNMGMPDVDEF